MSYAAQVAIAADRYTPCVRTITFRGLDLTGVTLRMQVRLIADTPGNPLIDLSSVSNAQAQGIKLLSVNNVDSLPVSTVQIRINETAIEGLPYSGERGNTTSFDYDLQGTLGGDKRVLMAGSFAISPGVTGADNAPLNRPFGYGGSAYAAGMRGGAILTFGETRVDISIDGADLIAPLINAAKAHRDAAAASEGVAADSAETAGLAAATAQASSRYFKTRALGEAGSTTDQLFTTDDAGDLVAYRRTASASVEIARTINPAALAAPTGPSRVGWGLSTLDKSTPKTLAYFGAPTSSGDMHTVLQRAFDDASEAGVILYADPGAIYKHDGPITLDGIRMEANGACLSRMNPAYGRVRATGNGVRLRNLKIEVLGAILGDPDSYGRGAGDASLYYGLWLDGATDFGADWLDIRGGAAAGLCAYDSHGIRIGFLRVHDNEADGLNFTGGSSNAVVLDYIADNNGDDQIAINGYSDQTWVQDIEVRRFHLTRGRARGIALLGGRRIRLGSGYIDSPYASALYMGSELNTISPAQSTHGVQDVKVGNIVAVTPCTTRDDYGAVQIMGRAGGDMIDGEYVHNQSIGIEIESLVVRGAGARMRSALSILPGTDQIKIGMRAEDLRTTLPPSLAELGGGNTDLVIHGDRIGGAGIIFTGTESGVQRIHDSYIGDVLKDGTSPINALIGFVSANSGAMYDLENIDLRTSSTQGVLSLQSSPQPGALRMVNVRRDGVRVREVDPIAGRWSFSAGVYAVTPGAVDEPTPFRATLQQGQRVRVVLTIADRAVLDWLACVTTDQSRTARLVESVSYQFTPPSGGVAGTDYVAVGSQYMVRSHTGPGEGVAGEVGLLPVTMSFSSDRVIVEIVATVALEVCLTVRTVRKTS